MSWQTILQILLNFPKIYYAFKDFAKVLEDRAKRKIEAEHQEALRKLNEAKTDEEKKDAFKNYVDNP
jgi:adenylate kinase